jgi:predicted small secreted protein
MKRKKILISGVILAVAAVTILTIHSCKKNQTYNFETAKVEKG